MILGGCRILDLSVFSRCLIDRINHLSARELRGNPSGRKRGAIENPTKTSPPPFSSPTGCPLRLSFPSPLFFPLLVFLCSGVTREIWDSFPYILTEQINSHGIEITAACGTLVPHSGLTRSPFSSEFKSLYLKCRSPGIDRKTTFQSKLL